MPATLRDVTWVASYMRDQDLREINAVVEAGATQIGHMMFTTSPGLCWVAWLKGQPVCAFGVARLYPGLGSCWAFGTRKMRRVIPAITRFGLRTLRRKVLVERFRRIEVRTSIDHDLSHAWLEKLGFEREGIAYDYGADGLHFVTYAVTRASDARRMERSSRRNQPGVRLRPEPLHEEPCDA